MNGHAYSDEQVMFSLAFLSYRGFYMPDHTADAALRHTIADGLEDIEPLRDKWRLVWDLGPSRSSGHCSMTP